MKSEKQKVKYGICKPKTENAKRKRYIRNGVCLFHLVKVFWKDGIMHGYNMAKCYGHIERYVGLHRSGMHKGLRLCFAVCSYLDCR